jgi:hypothetical protein
MEVVRNVRSCRLKVVLVQGQKGQEVQCFRKVAVHLGYGT